MSRIRSVHPGLFTDEAFAFLSDAAQVLLIGIWTECDDQGAFEWKPGMLRMRLRPGKDGSIEPLLAELEAANCVMSYEHGGRRFGLVRNFQRFQRPKKPNAVHFIPPEFRTYTGSSGDSSEPDADIDPGSSEPGQLERPPVPKKREPRPLEAGSVPKKGEKSPQMEDGGDNRRMEKDISASRAREPTDPLEAQLREAAGWQSDPSPNLFVTGPIHALIDSGADLDLDVLPVIKAVAPRCKGRKNWNYFTAAIAEARDRRMEAATIVSLPTATRITGHGTRPQKPSRAETFDAIRRRIDEIAAVETDDGTAPPGHGGTGNPAEGAA